MATVPLGPSSTILGQCVATVPRTSVSLEPSTQCDEMTSAMTIVASSPKGRTAHVVMGITTLGAFELNVYCDCILVDGICCR